MLRILILALCLLAVLVPVVLVAIAAFAVTVAIARHVVEEPHDLQRAAVLAATPFRAPPR